MPDIVFNPNKSNRLLRREDLSGLGRKFCPTRSVSNEAEIPSESTELEVICDLLFSDLPNVQEQPAEGVEFWPGWPVKVPEPGRGTMEFHQALAFPRRSPWVEEAYSWLNTRLQGLAQGCVSVIYQRSEVRFQTTFDNPTACRQDFPIFRGLSSKEHGFDLLCAFSASNLLTPNPDQVRDYLTQDQAFQELVLVICKRAREEFGPDTELSLELYRDPEIDDEYLTLYVRQPSYNADILDRIERVGQKFAEPLEKASGYLLLTTDFRPPRRTNAVRLESVR